VASPGASRTGRNFAELPRLIVIRGNSASGKSAVAAAIRKRHARRNLSIVSQDTLRRVVLRERDMRSGYRGLDLMPGGIEQIVPAESTLEDTVRTVMTDAALG
jgi:chloramphenicol 3-O-phosphotransferase